VVSHLVVARMAQDNAQATAQSGLLHALYLLMLTSLVHFRLTKNSQSWLVQQIYFNLAHTHSNEDSS
jgi:hypothetical protein